MTYFGEMKEPTPMKCEYAVRSTGEARHADQARIRLAARRGFATVSLVVCAIASASLAQEWSMPKIELPKDVSYPWLACTPTELANLKAAYDGTGPAHDVVAQIVARAEEAIAKPLAF